MTKSLCFLLALAVVASASDDKTDRATLRGIKAVCTVIEVAEQAQESNSGLDKGRLQSEMEARLRQAGIPIDRNATTCLYLNVRPLPAIGRNNKPVGLHAVDFSLEFLQAVTLARAPSIRAYAPTWSLANLATVPTAELPQTAQQITIDLVDRFLTAWRSVK